MLGPICIFGHGWHLSRDVTSSSALPMSGSSRSARDDAGGAGNDGGVIIIFCSRCKSAPALSHHKGHSLSRSITFIRIIIVDEEVKVFAIS